VDAETSDANGALPEATSHVIWDWNGTLLDDVGAVVEATTVAFRQAGIDVAVTGETYRRSFTRPILRTAVGTADRPRRVGGTGSCLPR
jgi:beta-phosphoglucomutase-like phosphatase (HAD superfamily)